MSQNDFPTSIRLPRDLKDFLKRQAEVQKRPLTYQILWVLQEYRKAVEGVKRK